MNEQLGNKESDPVSIIHAVLEVAPFGIYVVGKDGNIDYTNAAMTIIADETFEQFTSLNIFKSKEYKEIGLDKKIRAVFEGESFIMENLTIITRFSKKDTIRNYIGIPLVESGEKKALIFVDDITKIKEAEREIIAAVKMKSQFVSLVSHELRTPLAVMTLYLSGVLGGMKGPVNTGQRKYLEVIQNSIDRLSRLVNDVLDERKLEAGHMEFNMEEGDINAVIEEVVKDMSPLIKKEGLKPQLDLAKQLPAISFDRDKIIQVLTNLLNNALKFTQEGSITVLSEKIKDKISVSIVDTGVGIEEKDMHKLFRAFSQISAGNKNTMHPGTGLGLTISEHIIRGHNGMMEVRSKPGEGSTFSFLLPIPKTHSSIKKAKLNLERPNK